jgi:RNA polymerase sigma-70 factor (ECF subfamily)
LVNEHALIEQLKRADNNAFSALIDVYQSRVYNTCLGLLQNTEDAEDITQEVFVEVYRSVNGFKGDSKLSTWMYRIAVSKCLDHLRSKKRKKRFGFVKSLFGAQGEHMYDKPDFVHPGVLLEHKEQAAYLFKSIEQLPENQRIAFTLCKVEQLSYTEAGEIMQLSVSAVESLMVRARQNLKKILADYYNNDM